LGQGRHGDDGVRRFCMTDLNLTSGASNKRWQTRSFIFVVVVCAVLFFVIAALLTSIFQRKQEAKNPWVRLVEVDENTTDPAQWGKNWAREYDGYQRTSDTTRTRFGGSEGMPQEKIDRDPWLRRMFAGYA